MATRNTKATSQTPTVPPDPDLYCSFCGKSQHQVKKLIAGPKVYICDECVNLCSEILLDVDGELPKYPFVAINATVSGMLESIVYMKSRLDTMTDQLEKVVEAAKRATPRPKK